ncbi:hypothetical protein UFOVP399_47 [uncultured Caudovirales phage]|uniref:Uncharacterized protein n=1 Tax=uncultured Caudovirales phage TaxID=2100421 RepID=A0A6J5M409_9CAUD|nr:hypothetical protein UFOVP399_47 [uncultured Caudovirales phage]
MISSTDIATNAAAVTPSDTTQIRAMSLYVGGAGNIAVVMEDGSAVTFIGVPVGAILPIAVSRVNATNTTATNIIALR